MKTAPYPCPRAAAVFLAGVVLLSAPAAAQQRGDLIATVGLGVQAYPHHPGADELGIFSMPIFGLRREGEPLPVEARDESLGFGLFGRNTRFNFGPAVRLLNKRKEEHVGAPVGEVDRTVELGAFAEAYVTPGLRLRVEGRRGLGGHDGWLGDAMADLVMRGGETWVFSVGPRLRVADRRYMSAYYGVTPAVAARTGLPAYRASGGIHAAGASAAFRYQLSPSWGVHSYAGYDRLVGDAAESPIVRAFGSRDQFSGGLGLSYSFRVGR